MSANGKYRLQSDVNMAYWRELGVKYDAINELQTGQRRTHFTVFLEGLSNADLQELANITGIILDDTESKEKMKQDLLGLDNDKRDIVLYLRDFQNRKKKTINSYYIDHSVEQHYGSTLAQLYHLFTQLPAHLFSICTLHLWSVRGMGEQYSLDKRIKSGVARQVATEKGFEDKLCDMLYKASGEKNKYRIFSHTIVDTKRVIILLYKQIGDISRPDFNEAIRNQEVNMILFELNIENDLLEIKASTNFEMRAIREYAEITFGGVFTHVTTEVYHDYDKATFVESILNGKTASGKPVDDFIVEKVSFRSSPLKNSPEVTLQLKNLDIWPSVMHAYDQGSVNIDSIKDLASLSFKSASTSRTIKSTVKDNGNVIFTMDDGMLERDKMELIKKKFFEKFGIPMFQEISNEKFSDGRADLIDYVMAQTDSTKLKQSELVAYRHALLTEKLLEEVIDQSAVCNDYECSFVKKIADVCELPNECPICEGELRVDKAVTVEINIKNAFRQIKRYLKEWCASGAWELQPSDSELTHGGNKYKFINLERVTDNKMLQVMVTDQTLHGTLIRKLSKMMNPLIVVFVGQQEKFLEKYNQDCIQAVNFGKLYNLEGAERDLLVTGLYSNLELRAKNYVASAANKAFESMIRTVCAPKEVDKDYTAGDLEDDGYAMLKDLFPNTVKWGKEHSGKAVPEGVFSIAYTQHRGDDPKAFKYAFSYDCKFTRENKGYPLGIEEQRKAADYVRMLNSSDRIPHFAKKRQLTAHIFIYNHFSEAQIDGMKRYFEEHLDECSTVPIFLSTEVFTHLHELYRKHYEEVALARNYFLQWLYDVLLSGNRIVGKEQIDKLFARVLSKDYRETEIINMPMLTKEITKKDAI